MIFIVTVGIYTVVARSWRCLSLGAGGAVCLGMARVILKGEMVQRVSLWCQLWVGKEHCGIRVGLLENLKKFPGDYDCCCALQRGSRGAKKNGGEDADHTPLQGTVGGVGQLFFSRALSK